MDEKSNDVRTTALLPDFQHARNVAVETAMADVMSLSCPSYKGTRTKDVIDAYERATDSIRARIRTLYDALNMLAALEGRPSPKPASKPCCICGERHA